MLRVTRFDACEESEILRVEGRLTAADLTRFQQACADLLLGGRGLRLDLSGLQFADREAVAMLRALRDRGVALVGASGFLDALLTDSAL
ncbi:MAG: STAS domain-containing protein [Myxococcota bacterium]